MFQTSTQWAAIGTVMVILVALIHALSKMQRFAQPETIRKSLHVGMGLVTLSFPWIFSSALPVLALSIVSSLFISLVKVSGLQEWRSVVCARGRQSIGEICFPLAIGLTFLWSGGNKLLYVVPILILTLADAASAIVGKRFGRKKYDTADGTKTWMGSATFALVAFMSSFFPLHMMAGLAVAESLLIACILSILAMIFEGIAWRGLDNIFIPLGALIVLKDNLTLDATSLFLRALFLIVLSVFVYGARRNTTLNGSGLLASALFCYFSFVLGGLPWLIMPIVLYLTYRFLLPARFRQTKSVHNVYAVISIASAATIWLTIAGVSHCEMFIFPYALTFAAHAAIISTAHMRFTSFSKPKLFALLYAVLKAWCLLCLPLIFVCPTAHSLMLTVFLAPFCIGVPTFLFYASNSIHPGRVNVPARWWRQAWFAALASLIGLTALVFLGR